MRFCLYLLPFFAVFNTLLSCYLLLRVAMASPRWREAFIDACAESVAHAFPLRELAEQKLDEASLHGMMEQRYEGFIAALKRRIPMADMLMTGSIEAGIKEQVQSEIAKLLPELKKHVMERLMSPEEVQEWVKVYLQKQNFERLSIPRKYLYKIIFCLTAVSFSFGLLQLLLFLIFCT